MLHERVPSFVRKKQIKSLRVGLTVPFFQYCIHFYLYKYQIPAQIN